MPIKFWVPAVREPDVITTPSGQEVKVSRDNDDNPTVLGIEGPLNLPAGDWEQFDRDIREYMKLPAPYKRRENRPGTSTGVSHPDIHIGDPLPDEPAPPKPANPFEIFISDHALKTHLKKPGATFNCAGSVWERRGDGMLWHIGGPLPDGMGESLDNEQALTAYNGKSVTVTE